MNFKTCLVLALFVCLSFAGFIPQGYKQNDQRWSSITIGFGQKTIGEDGSLITSLASIAAGMGLFYDGNLITPKHMNNMLKYNDGFVQKDQVILEALTPIGIEFAGFTVDRDTMTHAIHDGKVLIMKLKNENRFVVGFYEISGFFYCMEPNPSTVSNFDYFVFRQFESAYIFNIY